VFYEAVSIQISSVKATGLVYRIVKTNTAHVTLHFWRIEVERKDDIETLYILKFFQHSGLDLGYLNSVLRSGFMPKRFESHLAQVWNDVLCFSS